MVLLKVGYGSDLELIEKLLSIYSVVKDINLRVFEKTILKYYIKYGYSLDIRDMIVEDTGKTLGMVKVTETELRRKGLLKKGSNNERKSELSNEMESLRNSFIKNKNNTLGMVFKND